MSEEEKKTVEEEVKKSSKEEASEEKEAKESSSEEKPVEKKSEKPENSEEKTEKSEEKTEKPKEDKETKETEGKKEEVSSEAKKTENKAAEDKDPRKRRRFNDPEAEKTKRLEEIKTSWVPKTLLGKKVQAKEITSMHVALRQSSPILEVEIVDLLLPDLEESILDVGRVQRTTDSGRRMRFRVVAAVGNKDGYVGIGVAKGKDAGPTIRMALKRAKLKLIEVKRGCGSWECGCGDPHTVPFAVSGKSGSVAVELKPAPRGVGLVSGQIAKQILSLSGVEDVWVKTFGHTRTAINFSKAVLQALKNTNNVKINQEVQDNLNVVTGSDKKKGEQDE